MQKDMIQKKEYNYTIVLSKKAYKDAEKLKNAGLKERTDAILNAMVNDPFVYPPSYEKLIGKHRGLYLRRINIQHRIVYKVDEKKKEIYILRMWTHYENISIYY